MDALLRDAFVNGLSDAGGVRLLAVDATSAAEEVRVRHGLWREAAQVAAEGLVAAGLLVENLPEVPVDVFGDLFGDLSRCDLLAVRLGLGAAQIRSLRTERGQAEMTCAWCSERYVVPGDRLESLEAVALKRHPA